MDVVYDRRPDNLKKIVAALVPLEPYLRVAPPGLPFRFDEQTLKSGLNFTLTTRLGSIDLFGEIAGGGTYLSLAPHCVDVKLFGTKCRVLDLATLIETKRAAGRPRDFEAIAELELLR